MPYIIGTAGHIDHGKTSLIKALTGEDTDRLKEEKERGISIDLGFAQLDLGDGNLAGVVDVPGHERFVRNMVAGATGSGKTTQLPKICIELGRESIGHIQPRRLAARTIAERIAEELGQLVGYQVRFTDRIGADTRIKLMTASC